MTRWLLILALVTGPTTLSAQNEDPKAVLGNGSSGTVNTTSPAVAYAFERATDMARASGLEAPSIEHILLALMDDPSTQDLLASRSIDAAAIRTALQYHLDTTGTEPDGPAGQDPDPALQRILRRTLMKSMISNKREPDAGDFIVAILVEGDSYAAQVLREQGLTVDEAEQATLDSSLARQEQQSQRVAEMKARIAERQARRPQSRNRGMLESARASSTEPAHRHRPYTLRITSDNADQEAEFKAAVSRDGHLDLYIESTPFEVEFVAGQVAALFEILDDDGSDGRLRVELIAEIDGQDRSVSGFGGRAGAVFDDPDNPGPRRSGLLR